MYSPLIAESTISGEGIAAIIALCTALGAGLIKGLDYIRKNRKEDATDVISQLQRMEARCQEDNRALEGKVTAQERRIFKLYKHVLYLEGAMRAKRMKFHPLNMNEEENKDPLGSDSHDEPMSASHIHRKYDQPKTDNSENVEGSD